MKSIKLLDCTLRDGAYVNDSIFGNQTIEIIIEYLLKAGVEIIECGWLKNDESKADSTYFHVPEDLRKYVPKKSKNKIYSLMIDYNRYDIKNLDNEDLSAIDMIRVTFPMDHAFEGYELGEKIKEKGLDVSFQLVNAKTYADGSLSSKNFIERLCKEFNHLKPTCICFADTFGSMYPCEVDALSKLFDKYLFKDIALGMHTHDNMHLAFANTIAFMNSAKDFERDIVVDGSLLGMGRGAGNTPTELLADYLNKFYKKKYNIDIILAIIDEYMLRFAKDYEWGYDPYLGVAGMMESHINNVAYLKEKYNISSLDLKRVLDKLDEVKRAHYNFDNLDDVYDNYKTQMTF